MVVVTVMEESEISTVSATDTVLDTAMDMVFLTLMVMDPDTMATSEVTGTVPSSEVMVTVVSEATPTNTKRRSKESISSSSSLF